MNYMLSRTAYVLKLRIVKYSCISNEVILTEINKCGIIKLNRPKALNSLNKNMVNLIYPTLLKWKSDPNINHVVIEGSGGKAFCAGGDIRQVTEDAKINLDEACEFFHDEYKLNYLIGTFEKPYISLINGITMGGGFGLSVHGKYRVATEKTVFAMPETGIGLYPDVGGSYFLPRLKNNLGIYLALVGHRLKGKDVLYVGVATHYTNSSQIQDLKKGLFEANNNEEVHNILEKYNETNDEKEFSLYPFLDLINEQFSGTTMENILESLHNKINTSDSYSEKIWCKNHVDKIRKMCPTSLKVTIKQLTEGRKMSLRDCFIMEYRLSYRCMEHQDFYEGVRAIIIDKDNTPVWNPSSLEDVTVEMVDRYFKPLPNDLNL